MLAFTFSKAQTDTVEIVFKEFYEIRVGEDKKQHFSILYDSTCYPQEHLTFIRVLNLGDKANKPTLCPGKKYRLVINRKFEHKLGCDSQMLNVRSNRAQTDPGTLFGSDFLERLREENKAVPCNYKAIEFYSVEEIFENEG